MPSTFHESRLYAEASLALHFIHQDLLHGRATAPVDIRPAVIEAGLALVASVAQYEDLRSQTPEATEDALAAALRTARSARVTLESHLRCYRFMINTKEPTSMGLASVERLGEVLAATTG